MLFVCAMLIMSVGGMVIAAGRGVAPAVNVPAAFLTFYLVITGLTTVRPPAAGARWLAAGAMLVALAVGLISLTFGFEALASGGKRHGIPAFPFLMFGVVGLLASAGDLRMIRSGGLRGAPRLARHLWRMCFALFIAAASFFPGMERPISVVRALLRMLGQPDEFPDSLRIPALFAVPVLAVLVTMLYWLWRVRVRRTFRPVAVVVSAPEAV
jgi:hypothetical protein